MNEPQTLKPPQILEETHSIINPPNLKEPQVSDETQIIDEIQN